MKKTALTIAIIAVGFGIAAAATKDKQKVLSASELEWSEVPNSGGVKIAPVVGDLMKGAHQMMVTFPAGTKHALHTHTHSIKLVTISGSFIYAPEGGPEKTYGPGSYILIPGGLRHTSGCTDAAPCVMFHEANGKFDNKPVAPKK